MNRYVKKLREILWIDGVCKSKFVPSKHRYAFYKAGGLNIEPSTIRENCVIDGDKLTIEKGAFINRDAFINCREEVYIGKNVYLAFGVSVFTATHDIGTTDMRAGAHKRLPVKIEEGCWIGAKAIILPGVTIKEGCVIAAGSVVTKDCEPNGLYGGVPAKRIKDLAQTMNHNVDTLK